MLIAATVGVGLTVIEKLFGIPLQLIPFPVKSGVTAMVPLTAFTPGLVVANGAMFPLPEAPNPMAVLLFVQEKEFPVPVNEMSAD